MDEYIKREDALKAITYNGLSKPPEIIHLTLLTAQKNIMRLPTADVVPRAELDILKSAITQKEEEAYNRGYADATKEIFEGIENIFTEKIAFYEEMKKRSLLFHEITYAETMITNLTIYLQDVTELKQTYTEQCPKCKHFIGCEEAVWSGRCDDYDERATEGEE